jgi:hypothetical protein
MFEGNLDPIDFSIRSARVRKHISEPLIQEDFWPRGGLFENSVVANEFPPERSDAEFKKRCKQFPPLGITHVTGSGSCDHRIGASLLLL